MEHVVHPQPGYPFTLALAIEYALRTRASRFGRRRPNLGSAACPYGCGQHPYLTLGTASVDTLELQAPGRRVLLSDERDLPKGSEPVDGTEFDFRVSRTIGRTKLDNAFTDLERGEDGRARVRIRDPESAASRTLWMDESYSYLMLFTGDTRPDVNRRSLAVEPMTCPPNAFRTGDSVIRLEPGESSTSRLGDRAVVTPRRRPRVLILGGGFAGVGAAQKLKDADAEVVLVDRHDYHTFQPLLYQLATGLLETTGVGHSLRDLLERHETPRSTRPP